MRVYYDFQIIAAQKYGGISRYFFELYTRLHGLGADARIGCIRSMNYYFREQFKMREHSKNRIIRKLCNLSFGALNKLNALIEMKGCDIIHPTYY